MRAASLHRMTSNLLNQGGGLTPAFLSPILAPSFKQMELGPVTKHTHRGHCQLCDRLQAINNKTSVIAKHGYTKRWSYFVGTCLGSGYKPYELSAQRIPPVIESVEHQLVNLRTVLQDTTNLINTDPLYGVV